MKRVISALTIAATVGVAVAFGSSGAAYATGGLKVKTVCTVTPLFTDQALTVPAAFAPGMLEQFYLEGNTGDVAKVEGPVRVPAVPTAVYYAKNNCFQIVGLHI
jgi:hypothetical protein